jgi:hypothetical protein
MLLQGRAGHYDAVQVDKHHGQTGKHSVHQPLEGTFSCIPQAKSQLQELEESKRSDDGRLRNVSRIHRNLVITFPKINF